MPTTQDFGRDFRKDELLKQFPLIIAELVEFTKRLNNNKLFFSNMYMYLKSAINFLFVVHQINIILLNL